MELLPQHSEVEFHLRVEFFALGRKKSILGWRNITPRWKFPPQNSTQIFINSTPKWNFYPNTPPKYSKIPPHSEILPQGRKI